MSTTSVTTVNYDLDAILRRVAKVVNADTDKEVAAALGVSASAIPTWKKHARVPFAALSTFAVANRLNWYWLILGTGPEKVGESATRPDLNWESGQRAAQAAFDDKERMSAFAFIPKFNLRASAGGGAAILDEQAIGELGYRRQWFAARGLNPATCAVISIEGESMQPLLHSGDIVLIDHSDTDLKSGKLYVLRIGTDLVVKYITRLPDGDFEASSENPAFRPFKVPVNSIESGEVEVIGRVRSSSRDWD